MFVPVAVTREGGTGSLIAITEEVDCLRSIRVRELPGAGSQCQAKKSTLEFPRGITAYS